jgi:hypothetical protein
VSSDPLVMWASVRPWSNVMWLPGQLRNPHGGPQVPLVLTQEYILQYIQAFDFLFPPFVK